MKHHVVGVRFGPKNQYHCYVTSQGEFVPGFKRPILTSPDAEKAKKFGVLTARMIAREIDDRFQEYARTGTAHVETVIRGGDR